MIFAIKVILKLCYDICNKLEELPSKQNGPWQIFLKRPLRCVYIIQNLCSVNIRRYYDWIDHAILSEDDPWTGWQSARRELNAGNSSDKLSFPPLVINKKLQQTR